MAKNTLYMVNPDNGKRKEAPVGISWTTLFFGPFPMLFRGSFKWFLIILVTSLLTFGASIFVFMFLINKIYIKDLLSSGFKVESAKVGTVSSAAAVLEVSLSVN